MVICGNELRTYEDFEKYFKYLKQLDAPEVVHQLDKISKSIDAPMTAKEYARKRIEEEVWNWSKEYIEDSIMIVFVFSAFINDFLLDNKD